VGLFGPATVIANDVQAALISDSRRTRTQAGKVQDAIRAALQPNESLLVIVADSTDSKVGVVTNKRVLIFRGGRLDEAISPDRISKTRIGRRTYDFLAFVDGPGLMLVLTTFEEANAFVTTIDNRLLTRSGPRDIPRLFPDFYRGILQATGKPQSDGNVVEIIDRVTRMVATGGAFAYFDQSRDEAARKRFVDTFTSNEDDGEFQLNKPDLMIDFLWEWNPAAHDALRRLLPRIHESLTGPDSFLWDCGDEIPPWSD